MIIKILFQNNYPIQLKIFIDFFLLSVVFYLTDYLIIIPVLKSKLITYFIFSLIPILILYFFNNYNNLIRYFSINDCIRLLILLLASSVTIFLITAFFDKVSIISQLIFFLVSTYFLISYRLLIKVLFTKSHEKFDIAHYILIFSAGNSGILTKRAFYNNSEYKILGFIDDDKSKIGKNIDGIKVFKLGKKLNNFISKNSITKVIVCTEKITSNRRSLLYNYFNKLNVQLLKLPHVSQWINGIPNILNLKEIKIEDLLSRGIIKIDNKKNKQLYNGKSILVTGGAGSIGKEIIRQLIKFKPSKIILLDNAETPMFNIKEELDLVPHKINITYNIDSVCDEKALNKIFSLHKIDLVIHAAAYKHVNMMEANPRASIINNVYGTKLLIDFSIKYSINKFILISSDKAVNPTNVMGASKRICELYMASKIGNSKNKTKFITTRFGNVLGSNGSVVPIFKKQIKNGGPVTITHPEIERYFMTIPEASQLVLEAGTMGKGGEIFVFDMGNPVKILDLAKNMIIQQGLKIDKDINIEFTGLRPGEKLYEELLLDSENLLKTHNDLIYVAKKELVDEEKSNLIDNLIMLSFSSFDNFKIVGLMKKIVPEYVSNHSEFQILDNND